mgnify:FL=1
MPKKEKIEIEKVYYPGGMNASCDKCGKSLRNGYAWVKRYRVSDFINPVTGKPCRPQINGPACLCYRCADRAKGGKVVAVIGR